MILSFGSGDGTAAWALAPAWLALGAYAGAVLLPPRADLWVRAGLVFAWLAHAVAIVIDTTGIGLVTPGARFGFAPALSTTLWLVIGVYLVESRLLPLVGVRRTLAALGATAVVLTMLFPGELRPQALPHGLMGIATYGMFGAAVLHAVMLNRADRQIRQMPQRGAGAAGAQGMPVLRLERLTFRFIVAGFALLTATLALGWWFATPWHWDHKKVFSLLAWGVFAALLIGRHFFGWRGRMATRWLYTGAGLLLLAYVGSRFVFEVVLHRPPA
jgi:ABC-type uncharacterized transport system permease subunit